MDTFIDKLAQKRNAQEMILANMTAEAAKMDQMQNQMKAYDELMQEVHRVNLKTADNLSEVQRMLNEYMDKLQNMQENNSSNDEIKQDLAQLKGLLENNSGNDEIKQDLARLKGLLENNSGNDEIKQDLARLKGLLENNSGNDEIKQDLEQLKGLLEENFRQSSDFLHKENVKVYRNVQAAVTEELGKQTAELKQSQKENQGSKGLLPISILILLAVLADIAIHLFSITLPF